MAHFELAYSQLFKKRLMTPFRINDDLVEMENLGMGVERSIIHVVAELPFQTRVISIVFSVFVDGARYIANCVAVKASRFPDIKIASVWEPDFLVLFDLPKVSVKLTCRVFVELGSLRFLKFEN